MPDHVRHPSSTSTDHAGTPPRQNPAPDRSRVPLATEEVAGPLQLTRGGMLVWFILGGQSWDFRTLDHRRRPWDQQTQPPPPARGLATRGATNPAPGLHPALPLPQVRALPRRGDAAPAAPDAGREVVGPPPRPRPAPVIEQILQVENIVTGPGFHARRATAKEMAFLFHRSPSIGVPAPVHAGVGGDRWQVENLAELTDRRVWLNEPYGPSGPVVTEPQDSQNSRTVCNRASAPPNVDSALGTPTGPYLGLRHRLHPPRQALRARGARSHGLQGRHTVAVPDRWSWSAQSRPGRTRSTTWTLLEPGKQPAPAGSVQLTPAQLDQRRETGAKPTSRHLHCPMSLRGVSRPACPAT